ncbi:hypothetical protein V8E54_009005 [Elaphomyces granulatus]
MPVVSLQYLQTCDDLIRVRSCRLFDCGCLTAAACLCALFRLPTLPIQSSQPAMYRELEASAEECPDRELEASRKNEA